jgi:PAS domain S-box-containing protein/putative nucleotidyltransferase with HDIG domain
MDGMPLYSSKLTKIYTEYLRKYYPDIDLHQILQYADIAFYQLEDAGHWFTQKQVDRFHDIVVQKTNNPTISREVGRYGPLSAIGSTYLSQYMLGFLSPLLAYSKLEQAYNYVSRGANIRVSKRDARTIDIIATPNPGVHEKDYQCQNRIGFLESIAQLFTGKLATIEHPTCIHRGGDTCHYIVSWESNRAIFWKRIRDIAAVLSIIATFVLLSVQPVSSALVPVSLCVLLVASISIYQTHLEKKELGINFLNTGDTSNRLLNQVNITYNNALLIQKIGQAATAGDLDNDTLLRHIMQAIKEYLDFDRGIIMLANRDRTRLEYKEAYGYDLKKEHLAQNLSFHLDNPESKGHFVLAFKQQRAFLVNDLADIKNSFSPKSFAIAKAMGVQSFICVPIIYEGIAEGVLAVDNIGSKRILTQSDLNLLLGIAPHIAISINTAKTYQKVRESEAAFRALGENSPDIIYTLDGQGKFTYINPAWETLLGYTKKDVLGKYFSDFIHEDSKQRLAGVFTRIRDNGETIKNVTCLIAVKDGSFRHFTINGSPNFDSQGQLTGLVGTMKDVTTLEENVDQLQTALDGTINTLSSIVESRDPYTAGHQKNVTTIACAIAHKMALPDTVIDGIRTAAMIHDIGKIYIPAEILNKPGILSKLELDMVKTHAEVGYNILKNITFPRPVALIVYQHHERLDGSGYPQGLSGSDILIEARIIAVADVVEAMINHRPYRPALGVEQALEEIERCRASMYDSQVVDACLKLFQEKVFTL